MRTIFLLFIIITIAYSCKKDDYKNLDCGSTPNTYSNEIAPMVSKNCSAAACHGSGSANGDYTSYVGLKVVADKGSLENKVLHDKTMPPSKPLPLEDRRKLKCWIEAGAPNN